MTTKSPPRRLYRSRTDRMLGGVAGGVAAYLQVDPTLTRLAFVALALAAGTGVLAYIIAWIVIPEEPLGQAGPPTLAVPAAGDTAGAAVPAAPRRSTGRGARLIVGAILVAVGCILLLDWAIPDLHHFFWPAAIIVFGLGLLAYGARR
jgi:phage shock protein PspC (stress-responsive transcriptional regulator)